MTSISKEYYIKIYLSIRKVSGHFSFFLLTDIWPCLELKHVKSNLIK
jgi:hypothetical protein